MIIPIPQQFLQEAQGIIQSQVKVYLDVTQPQVDFSFKEVVFTSLSNITGIKTNTTVESIELDNFDTVSVEVSFLDYKNEITVSSLSQTMLLQQPVSNVYSGIFSENWNGTGLDNTYVDSGIYIYRTSVSDLAGNITKKTLTLSEKSQSGNYVVFNGAGIIVDDAAIFASPSLFNPNSSVQNKSKLSFEVQHKVLEVAGSGMNDILYKLSGKIAVYTSSGTLVRTLYDSDAHGLLDLRTSRPGVHNGQRFELVWDGRQNNSSIAGGGSYCFKIVLTDNFGVTVTKICPVTIDDPEPEIQSVAVQADGKYRIVGKAVNRRGFSSYSMFYRKTGDSSWNRLAVPVAQQSTYDSLYPDSNVSYTKVDGGLLAEWDVFGLVAAQYEIKLSVTGTGGVYSTTTNITISNAFSVRNFAVNTPILSPDGDGVQDTLTVSCLLPDSAQCTFKVRNKDNTIVFSKISQLSATNYPATVSQSWDGLTGSGTPATGGVYAVELIFNNGLLSVVRKTNITVVSTNESQNSSGYTNVMLVSPTEKNSDGSHKYVKGIPFTWQATARGARTPVHRVEAAIQATGKQVINRYPNATAVIEIGRSYNKIKVDRVSWTVRMRVGGWFAKNKTHFRYHVVDYTNSSGEYIGFLVDKSSITTNIKTVFQGCDSSTNMTPSQDDRFSMHYKASDIRDCFGPDTFGSVTVIDRKIESFDSSGKLVEITDAFNWNIGLDITKVNAAKVFGESITVAAVEFGSQIVGDIVAKKLNKVSEGLRIAGILGSTVGTEFGADTTLVDALWDRPDSVKQDRLKAFNAALSIGCRIIPKPAGAIVAAAVSFIANIGFGDYSDEIDINIPITLNSSLSFQAISEYGFSNFFMNDMAKQVSLSWRDGRKTITFPGVFSKFKKYSGILVDSISYTNIKFRGFSYIPRATGTAVVQGIIDIDQNSCKTNIDVFSKFWSIGVSSDTNGDPIVFIRNNFSYQDVIPWPILSSQQFYSYVPDGVFGECMSNIVQNGIYCIKTNITTDSPFTIFSIRSLSNSSFFLPAAVSNINLFSRVDHVSVVNSSNIPYTGFTSDADPSLLRRVEPSINYFGNGDAGFTLKTSYKEENVKLEPGLYGHIGLFTNLTQSSVIDVFSSGYYSSNSLSGWHKAFDTDYSSWEYSVKSFDGSKHAYLKSIGYANTNSMTISSDAGARDGLKKIYPIYGSADLSGFQYYKLEYGILKGAATQPESWFAVPMPVQSGGNISRRAVTNGLIGLFDVTNLKEGRYRLLLTVAGTNIVGNPIIRQKLSDIIWYNEPISIFQVSIISSDGSNIFDPEKGKLQIDFYLSESTVTNGNDTGVLLQIRDVENNTVVRQFQQSGVYGVNTLNWDGTSAGGSRVPDGNYYLQITAYDTAGGSPCVYSSTNEGKQIQLKNTPLQISSLSVAPAEIVPAGAVNKTSIKYILSKKAGSTETISLSFLRSGTELVRVLEGTGISGENKVVWDGKDAAGNVAASGVYDLLVSIAGVTNIRMSNCVKVRQAVSTECIALLKNPDTDGDGQIEGQSGNYFKWVASLSGQYSSNQLAHIALTSHGINYKDFTFDLSVGLALRKKLISYIVKKHETLVTASGQYPDSFSISHPQRMRIKVDYKGSNEDKWTPDKYSSFTYTIRSKPDNKLFLKLHKQCGRNELDYEEIFTIGDSSGIATDVGFYGDSTTFPSNTYNTWLKNDYPDGGDHCNITVFYRDRELDYVDSNLFYFTKKVNLVYVSDTNKIDSGFWRFRENGCITNALHFSVFSPFITNWSPNAEFTNLCLYYYQPYHYLNNFVYSDIVSDLGAFKAIIADTGEVRYNLVSFSCGENVHNKTIVNVSNSGLVRSSGLGALSYDYSRSRIDFVLDSANIARSGSDKYWNPSGHFLSYVNAFSPVTNALSLAFTNIHDIPAHVYVHWFKASNANPGDGITPVFLHNNGQFTTNINDYLIIKSDNIVPWSTSSTSNLQKGRFSGTSVLPYCGNSVVPLNIFDHNQQSYNPEKLGNGNPGGEVRIKNMNLVLKKGDRVLVIVSNNQLIKNNSDVQIVDKDTHAPLAEKTNLIDYCSAKKIPENNWLESVYLRNNIETASTYIPIRGTVSSGSNYAPLTYTLQWGRGENPSEWTQFASGSNKEGVLGYWDSTGKYGTYAVLLTVTTTNGQVKQAKQVFNLGGTVSEDQVTIVSSPYGTTTLAFPAGSIYNGDEIYLKKTDGTSADIVVYGKYDALQLPEGQFTGTAFSQADLSGIISMERVWLGGEGSQSSGQPSEDLKSAFLLNASVSNLDPGIIRRSFATNAANDLLINALYFKTDYDQYIEIYNPTANDIDLNQYVLGDGEGEGRFPSGSVIKASNIIVVARNAERFKERFPGKQIDYEWDPLQYSGDDDSSTPNLLAVSDLKPVYNIELNSSATRGVSLIPIVNPELYQNINSNQMVMGPVFDFKPDGLQFDADNPPTLTYRGKLSDIEGQDPATLGIYYLNDQNQVEFLSSSQVTVYDSDGDGINDSFLITAMIEHFSQYVLLGETGTVATPTFDTIPLVYNKNGINIAGRATAGNWVQLSVNNKKWSRIRVSTNGVFSFTGVVLQEGTNTITAFATDTLGRTSQTAALSGVILDTTPPVVIQIDTDKTAFSPNGDYRKDTGSIGFTVSESGTALLTVFGTNGSIIYEKSMGQIEVGQTNLLTWNGKNGSEVIQPEGLYRYSLEFYDNAGNRAVDTSGSSGIFTIDCTPPSARNISIDYPDFSPNGDGVKDRLSLTFDLCDAFSSYVFLSARVVEKTTGQLVKVLMSSAEVSTGSQNIVWDGYSLFSTQVGDGNYLLQYSLQDAAGNITTLSSCDVRVDTVPPTGFKDAGLVRDILKRDEYLTPKVSITESLYLGISVLNTDGSEKASLFSNWCPATNFQTVWENTLLEDGQYSCRFVFSDAAGNSTASTFPFLKDSIKPQIDLPDRTNDILTGLIEFTGTVSDANLDKYIVSIRAEGESTNWTTVYSASQSVVNDSVFTYNSGILNGLYTFRIEAYDTAGNTNTHLISSVSITNLTNQILAVQSSRIITSGSVVFPYYVYKTIFLSAEVSTAASGLVMATPVSNCLDNSGLQLFEWNGTNDQGELCPEGRYTVTLVARDTNSNNILQTVSLQVVIDRTPPKVNVYNPVQGGVYSGVIPVTLSIMDTNLVQYQIHVSSEDTEDWLLLKEGRTSVSSNAVASFSANGLDGEYTLRITALDQAMNSLKTNILFTVDSKPVSIAIDSPCLLDLESGLITVEGSVTGAGLSYYTVILSNASGMVVVTNTNQIISGTLGTIASGSLQDGKTSLIVKAWKESGLSFSKAVSIILDNTAPQISLNTNTLVQSSDARIGVYGSVSDENLKSYSLCMSTVATNEWTQLYTSAISMSTNALLYSWDTSGIQGLYYLRLTAEDKVGNVSEKVVSVQLSNLAPQAEIHVPLASALINGELIISGIAYAPFLQQSVLRITNSQGETVFSTNVSVSGSSGLFSCSAGDTGRLSDGQYAIVLTVVDTAGRSVSADRSFSIDNTTPGFEDVQTYPSFFNPNYTSNNGVTVSFRLTEAAYLSCIVADTNGNSIINLKKDVYYQSGSHYIVWDGKNAPGDVVDGYDYYICLSCWDESGNEVKTNVTVRLDSTPPVSSLSVSGASIARDGIVIYSSNAVLSLNAEDGRSGVKASYLSLNDSSPVIYSSPIQLQKNGTNTVQYYSIDQLGNIETVKSKTIVVDAVGPDISVKYDGQYTKVNGKVYITSGTKLILNSSSEEAYGQSGFDRTEYKIVTGDTDPDSVSWSVGDTVPVVYDGICRFYARAVDKLGNTTELMDSSGEKGLLLNVVGSFPVITGIQIDPDPFCVFSGSTNRQKITFTLDNESLLQACVFDIGTNAYPLNWKLRATGYKKEYLEQQFSWVCTGKARRESRIVGNEIFTGNGSGQGGSAEFGLVRGPIDIETEISGGQLTLHLYTNSSFKETQVIAGYYVINQTSSSSNTFSLAEDLIYAASFSWYATSAVKYIKASYNKILPLVTLKGWNTVPRSNNATNVSIKAIQTFSLQYDRSDVPPVYVWVKTNGAIAFETNAVKFSWSTLFNSETDVDIYTYNVSSDTNKSAVEYYYSIKDESAIYTKEWSGTNQKIAAGETVNLGSVELSGFYSPEYTLKSSNPAVELFISNSTLYARNTPLSNSLWQKDLTPANAVLSNITAGTKKVISAADFGISLPQNVTVTNWDFTVLLGSDTSQPRIIVYKSNETVNNLPVYYLDIKAINVKTIHEWSNCAAGTSELSWDGRSAAGQVLAAGVYLLGLRNRNVFGLTGPYETKDFTIINDHTPPEVDIVSVIPPVFSPNGDGVCDSVTMCYSVKDDFSEQNYGSVIVRNAEGETIYSNDTWVLLTEQTNYFTWSGCAVDGVYRIELTAKDMVGNQADSVFSSCSIDLSSPVTSNDASLGSGWSSSNVMVRFTASDPVVNGVSSGVGRISIYYQDNFYSNTDSITVQAEGTNTIRYYSIDAVGNIEQTNILLIRIDKTPPSIVFSGFITNAWYTNRVEPVVSISDSHLQSWSIVINESSYVAGSVYTEEGKYTLTAKAADLAGNQSEKTAVFYIDSTPPKTVSSIEDGFWSSTNFMVCFTAKDVQSGGVSSGLETLWVMIDGKEYTNQSVFSITNTGETVIKYYAVDKAGNKESVHELKFHIDRTAPTITITGVEEGKWYNTSVLPEVKISDDYVIAYSNILLNDSLFIPVTQISAEGSYTLKVEASDKAGNTVSDVRSFSIDTTQPTCSTAVSNETWFNSGMTISLQFTDPLSGGVASGVAGKKIVVTGAEVHNVTNVDSVTLQADGDYSIQYSCLDNAGNRSAVGELAVHVDTQPPVLSFTGFTNGNLYPAVGVVPGVVIEERALKTNYLMISRNDGEYTLISSGTRVAEDGTYMIKAYAEDKAGNSAQITASFRIDAVPPAIPSGLTGLFITDHVLLNWNTVEDTDLAGYRVYSDNVLITSNMITNIYHAVYSNIEGTHVYQVSAVDVAGNESDKSDSVIVGQSTYITFHSPRNSGYYRHIVKVWNKFAGRHNRDYRLSVVDYTNISTVPADWRTVRETHHIHGQDIVSLLHSHRDLDGRFVLRADIQDISGSSHQATCMFYIDNTAPITHLLLNDSVLSNDSGKGYAGFTNAVQLKLQAYDPTNNSSSSGIQYTRYMISGGRGMRWEQWNDEPVILSNDGKYRIHYYSRDKAESGGNTENIKSLEFVIDRKAPEITVSGISEGGIYSKKVRPVIVISDNNLDESGTCILLNGNPFRSGTCIHTDGKYTLQVVARDKAGHQSSRVFSFMIDSSAPVITVSGIVDSGVYTVPVTPVISFSDVNLATTSILVNSAIFQSGTMITNDGIYVLTAAAFDTAGNISKKDVKFVIDRIAPLITISGIQPGAWYPSSVRPVISITECNIKQSVVRLNGQPFRSGDFVSREGEWSLYVMVKDICNRVVSTNIGFGIDLTAPVINISGVNNNRFYNVDVRPVVDIRDSNLKRFETFLNGNPFTSGTTVSHEGKHSLCVSASDLAGNTTNKTVSFVVDKTAPVIQFYGVAHNAVVNTNVSLSVSIDEINLQNIRIQHNGMVYTGLSNLSVSKEGRHNISVEATDKAGNRALSSLLFEIDRTAPNITVSGITNGGEYQKVRPIISVVDDNLNTNSIVITLDERDFVSGSVVTNIGEHQLYVKAVDNAGNLKTVTISFSVKEKDINELLLFYASYNTSLDADYSIGQKKNYRILSSRTRNGYRYSGLNAFPIIGQGALYKTKENFNPERGTISLWVRNTWETANYCGYDHGRWILNIYQNDSFNESHQYMSLAVFSGSGTVVTVHTNREHSFSLAVDSDVEKKRWYADRQWTHVAMTYDMNLGFVAIYINGIKLDEKTVDPWKQKDVEWFSVGGRRFQGIDGSFLGWIDEIRIYSEPLNDKQIQQVYSLFTAIDSID